MKLLNLKCPNCNAKLDIDSNKKKYKCNYCGTVSILKDEKLTLEIVSSKLKNKINELKENYDNGNISYEVFEKIYNLLIDYPKNNEIKKYFRLIGIDLIKKFIKDNNLEYALYVANDLYKKIKDDKEIEKYYKKCSTDYYCSRLDSFELYDLEDVYELFSKYPEDSKIQKLFSQYREKVIEYLNNQVSLGYDGHEFRSNHLLDYLDPAFTDDEEIMDLFESFKEQEKESDDDLENTLHEIAKLEAQKNKEIANSDLYEGIGSLLYILTVILLFVSCIGDGNEVLMVIGFIVMFIGAYFKALSKKWKK